MICFTQDFYDKYFKDQTDCQGYEFYIKWIQEYPVKTFGIGLAK